MADSIKKETEENGRKRKETEGNGNSLFSFERNFQCTGFQKNCKRKNSLSSLKEDVLSEFFYIRRETGLSCLFFKVSATMAVQITPYYNSTHVSHSFDML